MDCLYCLRLAIERHLYHIVKMYYNHFSFHFATYKLAAGCAPSNYHLYYLQRKLGKYAGDEVE
jgi:hypothetical protein